MKQFFILFLVLGAFTLMACDDTESSPTVNPSIFNWIGDFAAAPYACTEDTKYEAYHNTVEEAGYICDGTDWRLIAQDGTDGTDGTDGISISWLGSFDTDPLNPVLNQAYANTLDGNSYIYNGSAWIILVQGRQAKLTDSNSTYLGYMLTYNHVMSPKGYVYSYAIHYDNGMYLIDINGGDFLFFESNNCTGTPLRMISTGIPYFTIMYSRYTDKFYKYNGTVQYNNTYQSKVNALDNSCQASSPVIPVKSYEYEEISRADAGIPETITPPYFITF